MNPNTYIVVHNAVGPVSAFTRDGISLIETVDWHDVETPDWDNATVCEPLEPGEPEFIRNMLWLIDHLNDER